jgi:hypothetical protein
MDDPTAPEQDRRPWGRRAVGVLGALLALEVVMVGLAVGFVAVYSHVLAPGQDRAAYEAYAQRAVPWFAVAASAPVFAAFALVCARRAGAAGRRYARTVTIAVVAFDAVFCAATPDVPPAAWGILALASALKCAGLLAGGRLGARADPALA